MIHKDDKGLATIMMVGLWMMGIAVLLIVASVVNLYFFIVAIPLFLIGLIVTGYAVLKGLHTEKKASRSGTPHQIPDCLIIAKFATNGIGEMIFNDYDILMDDPKVKFYVQMQAQTGSKMELTTNSTVWQTCGEGMRGTAMVQGDWLGAFAPMIGSGQGNPHGR